MRRFLLLCVLSISLYACKSDNQTNPLEQIHAAKVDAWIRYDSLMKQIDTLQPAPSINSLFSDYPAFTRLYFSQIINNIERPEKDSIRIFLNYAKSPLIQQLQDSIAYRFKSLYGQEQIFSNAIARLQQLIPGIKMPSVYVAITGFNTAAAVLSDTALILSPEMYFGLGSKFYDTQTWPLFIQRTMNKDNMAANLLKSYIRFNILPQEEPTDLLGHMLMQGKEAWLMEQILPASGDTLAYDYSAVQLKFCKENEKEIWNYFMREKLVYESNMRKIVKYINPSPDAPGMPQGAPGRIAAFTGERIVDAYLKRHPQPDMKKFLADTDARKILDQSRYKPE